MPTGFEHLSGFSVAAGDKFIAVPPDDQHGHLFRLVIEELFGNSFDPVVVAVGMPHQKILRQVKISCHFTGTGVKQTFGAHDIHDHIAESAVGIGVTEQFFPGKFGKFLNVAVQFTGNDFRFFPRKIDMVGTVSGNFVIGIERFDFRWIDHVTRFGFAEQAGRNVESCFHTIFIEHLDQLTVSIMAVIIAEGQCFKFPTGIGGNDTGLFELLC